MRAFWRSKKDCLASAGKGPLEYFESFLISLFKGAEMRLKFLMARRKKEVSPIKARMSLIEQGSGQFLITSVLAVPGSIPF